MTCLCGICCARVCLLFGSVFSLCSAMSRSAIWQYCVSYRGDTLQIVVLTVFGLYVRVCGVACVVMYLVYAVVPS